MAPELAERLLAPLGRRWDHTVGVARQARFVARLLDKSEAHFLIAAAYLHDIGYAPELIETGFHPLDGARFLRRHGEARLAALVAHHTGAYLEAQELGLGRELAESPRRIGCDPEPRQRRIRRLMSCRVANQTIRLLTAHRLNIANSYSGATESGKQPGDFHNIRYVSRV